MKRLGIGAGTRTFIACALLAVGTTGVARAADEIIWNDPPKAAKPPAAGSAAPIRDDYAPGTRTAPSIPAPPSRDANGAPITWSEPSMPSKDKTGKTNTSAAADPSGACREFQQDIIIDGKREHGHGRACRQPDGSWRIVN